ncbi:MAG: flagellar biosynthesis protein FlhB [Verrucomicrobiaceae bacterium]|nr:flagellar biosynthesis protein FlhB [Verrucomicrobiaceae bacterium]
MSEKFSGDNNYPNDERQAVALSYDGKRAPTVTAEGSGDLAEQIIAIAREHGVPLFENPQLLGLLQQVGLGEEIPETLYLCIAQVIAFAYRIQGKFPADWRAKNEEDLPPDRHSAAALLLPQQRE